ncbi:ABC transporter ATP-binding protein [Paenibacillus sp. YYML68]|uniref:ABC transporter ATP-binding protein n=1 Tax=Paenibacillus sp. YYML68 TaxID=2909250 RepID=UPI002490A3B8|nr:ABC transporter ATP-binding protein [Paenibacillus sp. YYML68]
MSSLQISQISKKFGHKLALENVSLNIETGMFGLLGPNGAGKTTLMRILTTLITPSSGCIKYQNVNWEDAHKVRGLIGYLPQKFSIYKQISVIEALSHIATMKGLRKGKNDLIDSVIEKVNLQGFIDKKVGTLSGGMVRRLGIAQAILGDPKIIIVDEPTTGLDPEERIRFRKLLRQLGKDKIIIISTHIVEDIEHTCDRAAVLDGGKVVFSNNISELEKIANGKVWEITLSKQEYYEKIDNLNVVSNYSVDGLYRVRVIAESPPDHGVSISPSLEDGYLYLMKKGAL